MKTTLTAFLFLLCMTAAFSQTRTAYRLPDIPGYITLRGDFHMHTPFSDGSVWPSDRVKEAWRDGLDVIAITDHLEYNPYQKDVSTDLNRPYEIAKPVADQYGILLIHAAEITRSMPPGHFNAFFITDANALKQKEVHEAFEAAARQNAFLIWNHPGWKAQQPDTTRWFPIHDEYHAKGWLHGIEVFNETEFYPIVHRWAYDKNLTIFANSDVHGPIDFLYDPLRNERRPMTLVFAKERSIEGVREAFDQRRTLGLFNDTLVGPEAFMRPLLEASLGMTDPNITLNSKKEAVVVLNNHSDFPMKLSGLDSGDCVTPKSVFLGANSSVSVRLTNIRKESGEEISMSFKVLNAMPVPGEGIEMTKKLRIK